MTDFAIIGDQDRRRNSTFGIIKTGGKQYKVAVGEKIAVEKIDPAEIKDQKIEFKDILSGKKVVAELIEEFKGPKILVSKFHSKKRYERHVGHRQLLNRILIKEIV